jgi:hypothetical protein
MIITDLGEAVKPYKGGIFVAGTPTQSATNMPSLWDLGASPKSVIIRRFNNDWENI